jgi:ATP-dependent DNA helicase UvrD/PcrA
MHDLEEARSNARSLRTTLLLSSGQSASEVLARIETWLDREHEIEIAEVGRAFLRGSRGELDLEERVLYVDKRFRSRPERKLQIVAHEVGHLLLHHDDLVSRDLDLFRGSVFLDQGASGLARYSPRSRQEAEASAFAAELVCPAAEIFSAWLGDPAATVEPLAERFAATVELASMQLAAGLYYRVVGCQVAREPDPHRPTAEQEAAATTVGSPVLVDAGPGTGKTKTLARRVEYLIMERGVAPEQILLLTFSNEAANELRERLRSRLGEEVARRVDAFTFHGFGVALLNWAGHLQSVGVDYSIADEPVQEEIVLEVLGGVACDDFLDLKNPADTAAEAVRLIGFLKDRLVDTDQLAAALEGWSPSASEVHERDRARALLEIFRAYEEHKNRRGQLDFADLILVPLRLLRSQTALRDDLRRHYQWVLVDEYQDVSRATALFLAEIAGPDNPPWVVGDVRQAIYRFRGADPENLTRFDQDFPGARTFHLRDNYRSAVEVIAATNELAELLELPSVGGDGDHGWRPGRQVEPLGDPIRRLRANSDFAEREAVAEVVEDWLQQGCPAGEIAVLARRNVDVRNIAIALKQRGIRAVTTGIITAEGGGGDLAAVVAAVDQPKAVARVLHALCRDQPPVPINDAIRQLLAADLDGTQPAWEGPEPVQQICVSGWVLLQRWAARRFSHDAWALLVDFLFFDAGYLRTLLDRAEDPQAAVQLEEILSTLALAANYRFTHRRDKRRRSRLGFAERLRRLLTFPAPGLVAPRRVPDAVLVMTCHAAKGLEFPCVVVAGQSLPDLLPHKESLPPALRPNPELDLRQADSLFFVGVSRSQRAVVVSYAETASGTPRSRRRRLPQLLAKWLALPGHDPTERQLPPIGADSIEVPSLWGGQRPSGLTSRALAADTCRVQTYVEDHLGARLAQRDRPLYPFFLAAARSTLGEITRLVLEHGPPGDDEIEHVIAKHWPPKMLAAHPHTPIYRPRLRQWTDRFVTALLASGQAAGSVLEEPLEWHDATGTAVSLGLQLIARFRHVAGHQVAIALEARMTKGAPAVAWSDLRERHRLAFCALAAEDPSLQPFVFYGEGGALKPFLWRRSKPREGRTEIVEDARQRFAAIMAGTYDALVQDWICDRCACRILCPWWIGAVPTDG